MFIIQLIISFRFLTCLPSSRGAGVRFTHDENRFVKKKFKAAPTTQAEVPAKLAQLAPPGRGGSATMQSQSLRIT